MKDGEIPIDTDALRELADIRKTAVVSEGESEVLALYFTPQCIRDHFEGDVGPISEWVASATDEQLREVGFDCVCSDVLYETFHRILYNSVRNYL